MFQKICQIASLLSLLLMGSLENKMPDVIKNTLPDFTGPSIEIPKKEVAPLGNTQN